MTQDRTFTFAVVGRNEAQTLGGVIQAAQQGACLGDRVWFVDSSSSDGSAAIARRLGAEVIEAPAGKGRAIAHALCRCETRYLCLLDADWVEWTINVPAALRATALQSGAEMVVGTYTDGRPRVTAPMLYWPLVDALLPDLGRDRLETPLGGDRAIDTSVALGELPAGFGIETHLNLAFAAAGCRITNCKLGLRRGPVRHQQGGRVAADIVAAILDFAIAEGTLEPELRPLWERWTDEIVSRIASRPAPGAPDEEFRAELTALAARPLPPLHHPRPASRRRLAEPALRSSPETRA